MFVSWGAARLYNHKGVRPITSNLEKGPARSS
jgi:hypothetical protein